MFRLMMDWVVKESRNGNPRGRLARLIGRNWARLTYGFRIEPTWLELNHCEIPVAGLPQEFAGFRIVQLSDFHCSRQVTPEYLGEAVDLAQGQNGDAVVLTGDFIHHGYKYVDRMAETLSRLTAPHGVFAVLGNHDYSVRSSMGFRRHKHLHRAVADSLTSHGIRVLHNETIPIIRGEAKLNLVGVEDLWSRTCDLDKALSGLCPNVPRVVLAHNPRTIEIMDGRRCDLMLSGHTHGGQVHIPGLGRPTLGKHARKFAAGLYQYENAYLYVNKGVGFGFRFRYGVRPEVAVLSLRASQNS